MHRQELMGRRRCRWSHHSTNNDRIFVDDDRSAYIDRHVQAHIPDIVLNNLPYLLDQNNRLVLPNVHTYHRVTLLFLDVSGFTSLTEQYSNDAHLGVDQLTHTLNVYLTYLVSTIFFYCGDIYKFAGDALLALWIDKPERALQCALALQNKYNTYETDVQVVLRLKIALTFGSVRIVFVGTDEFKHYILTGDCVQEVNMCEQMCQPGDIRITKVLYEQLCHSFVSCTYVLVNHHGYEHYLIEIDINKRLVSRL
jgi:class 3 adenylate cyclase